MNESIFPTLGAAMIPIATMAVSSPVPAWPLPAKPPAGAPNVVIILLDDVGYATTDLFGGPVKTPVLDQFAAHGLVYNRFHVSALCSPTRASLLTGRNDHRVGFGTTMENLSNHPGYDGIWKKSAAAVGR